MNEPNEPLGPLAHSPAEMIARLACEEIIRQLVKPNQQMLNAWIESRKMQYLH